MTKRNANGKNDAARRSVPPVRKPHRLRPRRASIALDELVTDAPEPAPPEALQPPAALPAAPPADLPARPYDPLAVLGGAPSVAADPTRPVVAPFEAYDPPEDRAWIYGRLAALFAPYAPHLEAEMHPRIGYSLKARRRTTGDEIPFGAVQALDDGVEFRLFPLFEHPELLAGISPALLQRMGSPTCFGFTYVDSATLAELAELTRRAFACLVSDSLS